jgi:protein-tyrosine phosphatase
MAQGLLAARLAERGVAAEVRSAGSLDGGRPPAPEAVAVMAERGIDIAGHRSAALEAASVRRADLVIGMAREHVREVVALEPSAWPKCFTLKELVRRASQAGPRPPGQPLPDWLAHLGAGREPAGLLGASQADDVADPVGGALAAFEATAGELAGLVDRLVELAWGPGCP